MKKGKVIDFMNYKKNNIDSISMVNGENIHSINHFNIISNVDNVNVSKMFSTLDKVVYEYEREMVVYGKADTTIKNRVLAIKRTLNEMNIKTVQQLSKLEEYLTFTNYFEFKKNRKMKEQSLNLMIVYLNDFCKFLVRHRLIFNNIVPSISKFQVIDKKELETLDTQTIQKILDHLKSKINSFSDSNNSYSIKYHCIYLIASLGLRLEEAISIKIDDIDLENSILYVRGKGYKGNISREIYLPKNVTNKLKEYLKLDFLNPYREYLFPPIRSSKKDNKHVSDKTIFDALKEVGEELGIENLHPHKLRHSFASNKLHSNQMDIHTIKDVLGHKSINTTSSFYISKDNDKLKNMIEQNDFE